MKFKTISILLFSINIIYPIFSLAKIKSTYNICNFGALGDGKTLATTAIQAAIDSCTITGGTVFLPAGTYLSGTIVMRSNVTLHVSEGATLLGSTKMEDYLEKIPKIRSYTDQYVKQSLIYGEDLQNIAITGRGTIDGQGSAFKVTTRKKPERYYNRPYIIRLINCKNVLVEDVTMQNSAMWMQHYLACDHLTIRGIRVYNHCNQNNDMIDIDGSRNVIVSDCVGDTDDDALTIKSTSGYVAENITVTNCILSSHCNAIKMGTESHGGFKNITISNCVVKPSAHPNKIYGNSGGISGITLAIVDGGALNGIIIDNIRIAGPRVPIYLRLGDRGRIYKNGMDRPAIGTFRNVMLSNIIASQSDTIGCSITGLPGYPIENISLHNISITFKGGGSIQDAMKQVPELPDHYPESTMFGKLPCYGFFIRHAKNVSLSNLNLTFEQPDHRYAVQCDDVQGLDISRLRAQGTPESKALIKLLNSQDVLVSNTRLLSNIGLFMQIQGEDTRGIMLCANKLLKAKRIIDIGDDVDKKEVQVD